MTRSPFTLTTTRILELSKDNTAQILRRNSLGGVMSITPDILRYVAAGSPEYARAYLLKAADEIERLQADVTELMSAANEALNDPRLNTSVAEHERKYAGRNQPVTPSTVGYATDPARQRYGSMTNTEIEGLAYEPPQYDWRQAAVVTDESGAKRSHDGSIVSDGK